MIHKAWWWLCVLTLGISRLAAADVVLQKDSKTINLSHQIEVLQDTRGQWTIDDVLSAESARKFRRPAIYGDVLNLGLTREVYWLKVSLQSEAGHAQDWILDLPFSAINSAQAYLVAHGKTQTPDLAEQLTKLDGYRYHAWPVRLTTPRATLYLRVQSSASLTLPLQLQVSEIFMQEEQNDLFAQAMYFGALLVVFIYSLVLGRANRERSYLLFAGFLGFVGIAMFLGNALANHWLYLDEPRWRNAIEAISLAVAGAMALAFTRVFSSPAQRWLDKGLQFLGYLHILLAATFLVVTALGGTLSGFEGASLVLAVLSGVLIFGVLLQTRQRGGQHSRPFEFAWLCITLGALIASLRTLGFLPSWLLILYAVQISIGVAAIFFSLAIFTRARQQRHAHENALKQSAEDRQKLIEHLQQSEQRLEQTVALRTQELSDALASEKHMREQYVRFGAMISHEFRNPLGVIETQTALLERELAAGIDRASKRIGSVRAATQRLALLFEKWLQSDRLNNLQNKLEGRPLELDGWLNDIVQRCNGYHVNHEVRLLPHAPLGVVTLDEPLMRIALLNLIDNACKYSPPQTVVSVSATMAAGTLCIAVADQGPGIPEELRLKVFEEYFRVDPDTPVHGVGLGLPFVKKIIALHGGRVNADEAPGGTGACFSIWIPVVPVAA